MIEFLTEFFVELVGSILWSALTQDRRKPEPSPWERRQAQIGWYWFVGTIIFLTLLAATWLGVLFYR